MLTHIVAISVIVVLALWVVYAAWAADGQCAEFGQRIGATRTFTARYLGCVAVMPDGTFRLPPQTTTTPPDHSVGG